MSILFIPHGGGPLPLLGDPGHASLTTFLQQKCPQFQSKKPTAILVISAHYETEKPTISLPSSEGLLYDYGGFPPEAYKVKYDPPPLPDSILQKLRSIPSVDPEIDRKRGLDHGVFVPLKLMYPQEDIPVGALSLMRSMDPAAHIELGKQLAPLLDDGVLLLGSGLSFHNMKHFFGSPSQKDETNKLSVAFHAQLRKAVLAGDMGALAAWAAMPHARECHPREEHLVPLLVCAGAGAAAGSQAELVFDEVLLGHETIGVHWPGH